MRIEPVSYFGQSGARIGAVWLRPDAADEVASEDGVGPVVVHCPGWSGTAESDRYAKWHRALTAAGLSVLAYDLPGRGLSSDSPPLSTIAGQQGALRSAIGWVRDRGAESVGLLGSGATGGSLVIEAATDPGIDAVVAQFPVATGRGWLDHLLSAEQRRAIDRVFEAEARALRAGAAPRWMDFDAVRRGADPALSVGAAGAGRVPVTLVASLCDYWPVDHAPRVRCPVLLLTVEDDRVVPDAHAREWASRLAGPYRLVAQRHVEHYDAYEHGATLIADEMTNWLGRHLARDHGVEGSGDA